MSTAVSECIRSLIVEHLDMSVPTGFDETTPLYDGGLGMDSFTTVELITLIENHFQVEFKLDEITPEHFVNVRTVATLVERYLASR